MLDALGAFHVLLASALTRAALVCSPHACVFARMAAHGTHVIWGPSKSHD